MDASAARAAALRPWMSLLDRLERCSLSAAQDATPPVVRARRVLMALSVGAEAPVPALVRASDRQFDAGGRLRDARPAHTLREIWCDRDAVLRLGVWGALERVSYHDARTHDAQSGFDRLMAAVSRRRSSAPPGLRPSLAHGGAPGGFAGSQDAAAFFNLRLRPTLANLARLYDRRGAEFRRWLLTDYVPGRSNVDAWSRAWTVAVLGTYLDWLQGCSGGSLALAADRVWCLRPRRFRPPARVLQPHDGAPAGVPRPAVLPTDAHRLHFDLHLPVVLAQLIDHDAGRWAALGAGCTRFAVPLSMKTLDQADSRHWDADLGEYRNFTVYRGLTVSQIYMAVLVDWLLSLPPLAPGARAADELSAVDAACLPVRPGGRWGRASQAARHG